jgi:transcription elongation regulator 1
MIPFGENFSTDLPIWPQLNSYSPEVKRKEAKKKEEAFVRLLDEKLGSSERLASESSADEVKAAWNRAKRSSELYKDPRYEPVGSSTRRAELFETWSKGQWTRNNDGDGKERKQDVDQSERPSKDAERALRLREEAVELKRRETEMEKRRAYGQATRGESHDSFRQLLVDAIRDPLMTITDAFRTLSSDGRFDAPGLRAADKDNLIQQHIDHLNEKRLRELERVFERHASSLDVEAEIALPLIRNDDEVERRQLDQLEVLVSGRKSMKDLFLDWRDESERQASMAFQQMLKENAFVNFWGRLRQEHKQRQEAAEKGNGAGGAGGGGRQGEDEEDEDDPDLLQMAGNIDLEEIHSILRVSARMLTGSRHLGQL